MIQAFHLLKKNTLAILLGFGLAHGLVYVFLVPPWSHYDEPGHFEYVWMIATRPAIPKRGEWDAPIRREILASMIRNDFFKSSGYTPNLSALSDPVPIGVTQVGDPPIYYWLASLPVRLLRDQPIESRLYGGRLISLLFFLATIIVARKMGRELSAEGSPLRWLLPLFVAALPSLVDVMTALNNDSAAIFVYSLFLFFGVKLIRRGLSLKYVVLIISCTVVGFFTKSSNWVLFIMLPLAILLGMARRKKPWLAWSILVAGSAVLILLIFQWDDPALWLRDTHQTSPAVVNIHLPGFTGGALQITSSSGHLNRLYQVLPRSQSLPLRGSPVTFGVWIWADHAGPALLPQLINIVSSGDPAATQTQIIQLSTTPQFFSFTTQIPQDSSRFILVFNSFEGVAGQNTVYFYRPILAAGIFDPSTPPEQIDIDGKSGVWGGTSFTNLVRSPTGTGIWPRLRPAIMDLIGKIDPRLKETAGWMTSLLDVSGTGWFVRYSAERIFRTFWATFGWGNIPLAGSRPFRPLVIITVIGMVGAILAFAKSLNQYKWLIGSWMAGNLLVEFLYALFTGISMGSITGRAFLPVARFIDPTILVIGVVLCGGWLAWIRLLPGSRQSFALGLLVIGLLSLDVLSIFTIYHYWI